jgi:uncharacterized repeat protein (TIGR01451 family)
MLSRGICWYMSARARRSLVLFWTALFVSSLLMQYISFGAQSALGVHDDGVFELDGNTANAGGTPGDDWDSHPGATGSSYVFIDDPLSHFTDQIFTGGGSKDDLNIDRWKHKSGSVPDKDNIEHAFAAAYQANGDTLVDFGLDRYANNGDAFVGFWFFKNGINANANGTFTPNHSVGDLLVLSNFTNGGTVSTIQFYEWVGSGGDTNNTLDLLASSNACDGPPVNDKACGIANKSAIQPSWTFDAKFTNGTDNSIPAGSFFEGGINLDDLFGGDAPCFSGFLAETRSSQSVDAVLKDVAVGDFDTCAPSNLTTSVSHSRVALGGSVTDTADFTNNSHAVTGSVKFFLCGPDGSNPDCSTGGTQIGGSVAIRSGHATSAAYSPTAAGKYCFRAEYTPDAAGSLHYIRASHTNRTTECFSVAKARPSIVTAADQTVLAGAAVSDSATLSGGYNPGGTITFKVYATATCSGAALSTRSVKVDAGNGTYGPVSYTPANAGTYHWIASYGGDANNNPIAGACGDAGENDTVNKLSPSIATELVSGNNSGTNLTLKPPSTVHDTATLTGATASADGTVTYTVYSNNTCSTVYAAGGTASVVDGQIGDSDPVTFNDAGIFYWQAVYSGDGSNNGATSLCTSEVVTITPSNMAINTELSGQGQAGQHITILYRNAVTDSATLSGSSVADAGGTVTYTVFADDTCATVFAGAGTKTVTNGVVPDSDPITFNTGGATYYWQAVYSGDANHDRATSSCTSETVTVIVSELTIAKSFTGNSKGTGPGGIPQAGEGDKLTYTLAYDLTNGPVHNGVITDTLPVGLAYISGSATDNAEFSFGSYDANTRVLTWTAAVVTVDGSVTYQVTVQKGAAELPQPLVNVATIDSDETNQDQDDAQVLVAPPPLQATATPRITLPPTDALGTESRRGGSVGFSLMLVLLGLAGFALAVGFITPAHERIRRRSRRG